ncbi:hypothetical protein [Candidatus Karelsulcia muelleri]|uniref:hypothetical protein n=1 Tax=Candidatus Karelsulcia muelleri TaxID=336810 RepID=UPI00216B66E6|nr:hypothetical protein [Candidatus Karelsulcia muelleri]
MNFNDKEYFASIFKIEILMPLIMKRSYNWLKKYISIICNLLTDIGFNVEKYKLIFIYNLVLKTIKMIVGFWF